MANTIGRIGEKTVQKKLWQRGYNVKDVSKYTNFDLFVNDNCKVEVKTINQNNEYTKIDPYRFPFNNKWAEKGFRNIGLNGDHFDILAVVVIEQLTTKVFYCKKDNLKSLFTNRDTLHPSQHDINGNFVIVLKPKHLLTLFETNPDKLFPKQKPTGATQ